MGVDYTTPVEGAGLGSRMSAQAAVRQLVFRAELLMGGSLVKRTGSHEVCSVVFKRSMRSLICSQTENRLMFPIPTASIVLILVR